MQGEFKLDSADVPEFLATKRDRESRRLLRSDRLVEELLDIPFWSFRDGAGLASVLLLLHRFLHDPFVLPSDLVVVVDHIPFLVSCEVGKVQTSRPCHGLVEILDFRICLWPWEVEVIAVVESMVNGGGMETVVGAGVATDQGRGRGDSLVI